MIGRMTVELSESVNHAVGKDGLNFIQFMEKQAVEWEKEFATGTPVPANALVQMDDSGHIYDWNDLVKSIQRRPHFGIENSRGCILPDGRFMSLSENAWTGTSALYGKVIGIKNADQNCTQDLGRHSAAAGEVGD